MRKMIQALCVALVGLALPVRADVVLNSVIANETALAHDAAYRVDLLNSKVLSLAAQAVFTSAATPAPVTFQDGRQSTGSINIADYSVLNATSAVNALTVASTSGLLNASISMPGYNLRQGIEWATQSTATGTAASIAAAFVKFVPILTVSRTDEVITLQAPIGSAYNSTALTSNVPAALVVSSPTFLGGRNNAQFTINGVRLTQGTQWSKSSSNATAATSLASAINTAVGAVTATANTPGDGDIALISNANGSVFNYGLASSAAAMTVSGPAMVGGVTASFSVGSAVISILGHGLTLGAPVLYTGDAAISDLTSGATYFAVPVTANSLKLAESKADALAGTAVVFTTVEPHLSANVATLAALPITGTPGIKWQSSNDNASWADISVASVTMLSYATPARSAAWALGNVSYRYVRALVAGPTTGGIALQISLRGTNTPAEQFASNSLFGDGSGILSLPSSGGGGDVTEASSPTWSGDHTFLHETLMEGGATIDGQVTLTNGSPEAQGLLGINAAGAVAPVAVLSGSEGNGSIFYKIRTLNDAAQVDALNWANRTLLTSGAAVALDWSNDVELLAPIDLRVQGNFFGASSVTASAFFGDGSNLTGIDAVPGGADTDVQFNQAGVLGASSSFRWDDTLGRLLLGPGDVLSPVTPATVQVFTTANANVIGISDNTNSSFAVAIVDAPLPGVRLYADANMLTSIGGTIMTTVNTTGLGIGTTPTQPLDVDGSIISNSSITASSFFGDGSNLTGITAGSETNTYTSSKTFTNDVQVQGNLLGLSSITASSFFGDGSNLTGIVGGSESNTYTSSKTFTNALLVNGAVTLTNGSLAAHSVVGIDAAGLLNPIGVLSGSEGNGAVFYKDRTLNDAAQLDALKWGSRELKGPDGTTTTLDWSTNTEVYVPVDLSVGGNIILGLQTMYYCSGSTSGTFDGNLARGDSNAAACAGGTWIATKIRLD